MASGVTVILHDGSELPEVIVEFGVGHPRNKQTIPSVRAKFKKNMRLLFSEHEIEGVLKAVGGNGTISSFVDLFIPNVPQTKL